MRLTRVALAAATSAGLALAALPAGDAAGGLPAASGADCRTIDENVGEVPNVTGENLPYDALDVGAAHALLERMGRRPGEGVTVVVVDSGTALFADHAAPAIPGLTLENSHGTIAAGLVKGVPTSGPTIPVGIAPAVRLVDAPFYEAPRGDSGEGEVTPSAEGLAARLDWVARNLRSLGERTVVLVPTVVAPDRVLARALRALRDEALVVASAGDRPEDETDTVLGRFVHGEATDRRPDEDAAPHAWPAGHDDVLTVGVEASLDTELLAEVVPNSQTDLSAPTYGGVSYAITADACAVLEHSTDWAAAVAAAAAALVWSAHPDDTPLELRSRLLHTAAGNAGTPSPLFGYGMVQPVEAIERSFDPDPRGRADVPRPDSEAGERAPAPRDPEDLLASTRRSAVWWGLVGGGALVVALVLGPLIRRRRS